MGHVKISSNVERHEQAFFIRQFVVAAAGILYWSMASRQEPSATPFIPIAAAVILNVIYYTLAAKRFFYSQVKWIQIPVDLALWTWLIDLTGGPWSLFFPLYAFEIMLAALTLSVAGCAYASALSIVLYSLVGYAWPGAFALTTIAPRLVLFAGTGAVCAILIRKLAADERLVRRLNHELRRRIYVTATEQDAVLYGMPSGLIGVDADGAVTMFNRMAERITGLAASDILDRPCEDIFGSGSPICYGVMEALREGKPTPEVEKDVVLNGRTKRLGLSCFALPRGFPTRSVCIFQDKTEMRKLERRTVRAETLSSLGTMAATLAHELRTPLTAIAGFASMLRERLASKPADAEIAGKIERGAKSLETVTRQLLSFTETPELSRSDVLLSAVVEAAIELLPEEAGESLQVRIDWSNGPINVLGDALQLRQSFLNLILNAREAAGDHGEIRLTLRRRGDEALVEVADNGPGVPEELCGKIFLPFFTTKKGGTGLGLAHSEKIIRAHGGLLTLKTGPGRGATFTAAIPISERCPPERPPRKAGPPAHEKEAKGGDRSWHVTVRPSGAAPPAEEVE